ncbi:hypothetical protein E4U16_003259 [Claviceps sp. LM84 group G4]|nr:hypothetical protein E4U16_003259 [Claviceps sp. LM84 group G4]
MSRCGETKSVFALVNKSAISRASADSWEAMLSPLTARLSQFSPPDNLGCCLKRAQTLLKVSLRHPIKRRDSAVFPAKDPKYAPKETREFRHFQPVDGRFVLVPQEKDWAPGGTATSMSMVAPMLLTPSWH